MPHETTTALPSSTIRPSATDGTSAAAGPALATRRAVRPGSTSTRRRRAAVALVAVLLPVAGCSKPADPEKTENWKTGQCVTIGGKNDIDAADCNGPNDGEIVAILSPLDVTSACPRGSTSVREDQNSGSTIQELRVCLKKRDTPTGSGTTRRP